jgi:hypothetical protein
MVAGALLHGHRPFPLEAIPAQAKSSESLPILRSFVCVAFPRPPSSPLMSLAEQSLPSRGLTWSGHLEPPQAQPSCPLDARGHGDAPPPLLRHRRAPSGRYREPSATSLF